MSETIIKSGILGVLLLGLAAGAIAQDDNHLLNNADSANQDQSVTPDHDMHLAEPEEIIHEHVQAQTTQDPTQTAMDHDAMDHSEMTEMDTAALRDPHAYSNGYELTSGPYALPSQRQVSLADEAIFTGVWMDRFEFVDHDEGQGTELEGYGWFGNSYRQLLIQAQIETVDGTVEEGEFDLLYSQAVSPFWDLRAGLHRSFGESADRDWAALGFKGLAPYWFEIDATLHLGNNGRTAFDFEAEYELLLTQRLVLQPRIDIRAFGKTDAELGHGSGLSVIKVGARLRYEFDRQFAPYVGVERVKRIGETADLLPLGSNQTETHWVLGLRFWF